MDTRTELTFLVSISRAAIRLDKSNLRKMVVEASAYNKANAITGVLLLAGNHFIQILEGSKKEVHNLLDKLRSDGRHTELKVLHEEFIAERRFQEWSFNNLPVDGLFNIGVCEVLDLKRSAKAHLVKHYDLPPVINFIQSLPKFFADHRIDTHG